MNHYDPDRAPDPEAWLQLDEGERIRLVEKQHRIAREQAPSLHGHALVHVIVENQIAEGLQSTVETIQRLTQEGLTRHDALHAVGSIVAEHMFELMQAGSVGDPTVIQARFVKAFAKLSAASWRAS